MDKQERVPRIWIHNNPSSEEEESNNAEDDRERIRMYTMWKQYIAMVE